MHQAPSTTLGRVMGHVGQTADAGRELGEGSGLACLRPCQGILEDDSFAGLLQRRRGECLVLSLIAATRRRETEEQARRRRHKETSLRVNQSLTFCVGDSLLTAASDQLRLRSMRFNYLYHSHGLHNYK